MGETFRPVDDTLGKYFLLVIVQRAMSKFPTRGITHLLVNQTGMEIPNPTLSTWENLMASCVLKGNLVADLQDIKEFKTGEHNLILREGRGKIWRRNVNNSQAVLEEAMEATPDMEACRLRRGNKTGAYLTMFPSKVNRMDLGGQ